MLCSWRAGCFDSGPSELQVSTVVSICVVALCVLWSDLFILE